MRALVIGASGLVGSALMRALERNGIEAVGTSHSQSLCGVAGVDEVFGERVGRQIRGQEAPRRS